MIEKMRLEQLYLNENLSMQAIASGLGCSLHKVEYWMSRYGIKRRSISEAVYLKNHPQGDPFSLKPIKTLADARLLGIGAGLYWGEGTKSSKHSVRLGNTDPALLRTFILFLTKLCCVQKEDLRFGLQIFTDIDPAEALAYWTKELGVEASQFGKLVVTISGSIGTYRKKSRYGVVTLHYHNKKLRDIVAGLCRDSSVGRAHQW